MKELFFGPDSANSMTLEEQYESEENDSGKRVIKHKTEDLSWLQGDASAVEEMNVLGDMGSMGEMMAMYFPEEEGREGVDVPPPKEPKMLNSVEEVAWEKEGKISWAPWRKWPGRRKVTGGTGAGK